MYPECKIFIGLPGLRNTVLWDHVVFTGKVGVLRVFYQSENLDNSTPRPSEYSGNVQTNEEA